MTEFLAFVFGFIISLVICIIFFRAKKPTCVGDIVIEHSYIPCCYMALSIPFDKFQEKKEVILKIKHVDTDSQK